MKQTFLILALFAAQHSRGQEAPDFTITDIDGQSHNLYTELDAGKTVVLKFFTNWCSICNNTAENVEALWQSYQTAGNDVLIWALDRDANETNVQATAYRNNNGLTFPVIGEANSVAQLYGVVYQPEYYIVCPDRSFIKKVSYTQVNAPVQDCLNQTTGVVETQDGSSVVVQNNAMVWRSATMGGGMVIITDLSGRVVQQGNISTSAPFLLESLNTGIHIYRLTATDGRVYEGKISIAQ